MAKCTKEKALETRDRIIDAAADVFHAKGVSRASLADIADAANVTRGAIYWHFKNKADLFYEMCQRIRMPIQALSEAITDDKASAPLGQLRAICHFVFRQTVENQHYNKILRILSQNHEFLAAADPILIRQQEWREQGAILTERIISNAIAKGQLPGTLDARLANILLHSIINGLLTRWFFAPCCFDLIKDGEKIISVYVESLLLTPSMQTR